MRTAPPSVTRSPARRGLSRRGSSGAWWAVTVLAAAAAAVSGYLAVAAARGIPPVCIGGGCAEVAASPFAWLLGLPTAAWGLALSLVAGFTALAGARWPVRRPLLGVILFALAAFGALFSAYLQWVQVAVLGAACVWCVLSAALWVVLLLWAFAIARGRA
jgi:uncharacterized membrane protein